MAICPRVCRISDDLFQNYEVIIDLIQHDNEESICMFVKLDLIACLKRNNFHHLASLADKKKFHIHNGNIESFFIEDVENIIWICSHC